MGMKANFQNKFQQDWETSLREETINNIKSYIHGVDLDIKNRLQDQEIVIPDQVKSMANWLYGEMTGGNGEEGSDGSEGSESDLINMTFDLDNYDEFLDGLVDEMEDVVGDIFEEGDIAE